MKIQINKKTYTIDSNSGIDISIPINFNSNENPKFYDSDIPKKKYYKYDDTEYSIDSGSGCNVPMIELNIHCMGTHTETANHISENGVTINMIKKLNFIPSQLITITPIKFTDESYHASKDDDLFIYPTKKYNLKSPKIKTNFDHRIAMSFSILGSVIDEDLEILESECINTSFPHFAKSFNNVGGNLIE